MRLRLSTVLAVLLLATALGAVAPPVADAAPSAMKPAVRITGLSTTSGPTTGGTKVTLHGTHLSHTTAVLFGSKKARHVRVRSDRKVTVVTPAHVGGGVPVRVRTSSATSKGGPRFEFRAYVPLAAGEDHACQVRGGKVRCWGRGYEGQSGPLGTGVNTSPVDVPGLSGVVALAAGDLHTCALLRAGTVSCWGNNNVGQLGRTGASSSTPSPVAGLGHVVGLTASALSSCALLADGSARCWGDDDAGQLGNGGPVSGDEADYTPTPVTVLGLDDATAITSSGYGACAVSSDGRLRCWGGAGLASEATSSPVLAPLKHVTSVALGDVGGCALVSSRLACWGNGDSGELGNGSRTTSYTPVTVSGLTHVTAVTAGDQRRCAVDGGSLYCWGDDSQGGLGDAPVTMDSSADAATPVAVVGGQGLRSPAAGGESTCALRGNDVWCWGDNHNGQLGNGLTADSGVPVKVG